MKKLFFLFLATMLLGSCESIISFVKKADEMIDTGYSGIQNAEYRWQGIKQKSPPPASFKLYRDSI